MHAANDRATTFEYKIGDLARLYNLSFRTLRFYEEKELLRPKRIGNQRVYSRADRTRLEIIILAKRLGFSLGAIWEMIEKRAQVTDTPATSIETLGLSKEEIGAHIDYLTRELRRIERAIDELRAAADRFDTGSLGPSAI